MTWLFCFLTSCNQENSYHSNNFNIFNTSGTSSETLYIKRPDLLLSDTLNLDFRYQLINDTSFVLYQDTLSFEIYHDLKVPNDYYLNCFKNHIFKYSLIINPQLFSNRLDSNLLKITQISEPEIFYFSEKYKKLFLWFNLGLPNQQAYNKGLIGLNEQGKPWFTDISSNEGFSKYQYFASNDTETILLGNYLIQLENENIRKIEKPFLFSGFLNSQSFFILDDPIKGDTFVQETFIDEWGNEKIEYYRVIQKDSFNKNLIIFNLNGDTLYKLRFDGICEDDDFGKQVCFAKSDSLKIGVFYDLPKKLLRIFDLITLTQKVFFLKDLISDYPEDLPYIDIPVNCYLQEQLHRGEKKLRIFFQKQKPVYYLFLHSNN